MTADHMTMAVDHVAPSANRPNRALRTCLPLLAGCLLLTLAGDRRGLTAGPRGIDPLEILNLQIKPNIIVVFDSSGSMRESPAGGKTPTIAGEVNYPLISGDWSGSKMFQAKQVLNTVIAANDQKASFLFGRYTQDDISFSNTNAGADRFSYTTQAWIVSTPPTIYGGPSPSMGTTQLTLRWEPVVINAQSNTFYYNEQGTSLVQCAVTLPNGIYATTAEHNTLATALATAMNGCTARTSPRNTYSVAWNSGTRRFTITRTNNSNIRNWQVIVGGTNGAANSVGYTTSTALAANATVLTPAPAARGFQAFQDIQGGWNILNFQESGLGSPCGVSIATGVYLSGAALAAEMQTKMNACPYRTNLYNVTYLPNAGTFRFDRRSGASNFSMLWGTGGNAIRAVLGAGTSNVGPGTSFTTASASPRLLRRGTASGTDTFTETYDPDGTVSTLGSTTVYTYRMIAGRFWNGQVFNVIGDGTFCGFGGTSPANPPGVRLQEVSACGGGTVNAPVFFEFAGGQFDGNSISCNGFSTQVPLSACDSATAQITAISPFLRREIPLDSNGNLVGYAESTNGAYSATASPPVGPSAGGGGIVANGATPVAGSLAAIKTLFDGLWTTGQVASPGPPPVPALPPISAHLDPKERTIVLFVTDGNDTCAGGTTPNNALVAANRAQRLYYPIVGGLNTDGTFTTGTDPASSVSTYMVGYGQGGTVALLNYIAWGGSGLGAQMCPANNCATWAATPTAGQRAACKTCVDAYLAPDAASLARVVESIINQGATSGFFTAQSSLVEPVYEYVAQVTGTYSATNGVGSSGRYQGLMPVLFRTTFSLPGFQGHVTAITNDGSGNPVTRWDAGQLLTTRVTTGMSSCSDGASGQGIFSNLVNGSPCVIPRRIYTTPRNGVFPVSVGNLISPTFNTDSTLEAVGNRTTLWPPSSNVNPTSTANGSLDAALGLPMTNDFASWTALTDTYKACLGSGSPPLPADCTSASDATRVPRARKEAREMILAHIAGAQVVLDSATGLPARKANNPNSGEILYQARPWVLGESTMADSAVVAPPMQSTPTGYYDAEYVTYRDGPRNGSSFSNGLRLGFGLRNPDVVANSDVSSTLNPVMTVIYVAANDMLHAFRAGPSNNSTSCTPAPNSVECGGEELWGFVPFDQLGKLKDLMPPQTRENHAFVMASPIRYSDVFVPNPGTTSNPSGTFGASIGGIAVSGKGVWRKMLIFGRGIGGKHLTVLDVTAPGTFTDLAAATAGPIAYWSRGNPDTDDGKCKSGNAGCNAASNSYSTTVADYDAFLKMGETWSVPAVALVNKLNSARKPCPASGPSVPLGLPCSDQSGGGVELVALAGSGFSETPTEGSTAFEGATFYTLDLLTGDVVASADVGSRIPGPTGGYPNALVASAASYAPNQFEARRSGNPFSANAKTTRVYIGDLHGRLWKFLAADLTIPVLFQDLGVDQPVGSAAALIKLPSGDTGKPHVYVTTGNDSRANTATGQFQYFAFRDDGSDTDFSSGATPLFTGELRGVRATDVNFRGTTQPLTVFDDEGQGELFFAGTRFLPPPPQDPLSTPVPPYPCRSRFDSIVFGLGARSGEAAYDVNAQEDDRYVIFDNSRIVAVTVMVDPKARGGAKLRLDEGLNIPGVPPPVPPKEGPRPVLGASVQTGSTIGGSTTCK